MCDQHMNEHDAVHYDSPHYGAFILISLTSHFHLAVLDILIWLQWKVEHFFILALEVFTVSKIFSPLDHRPLHESSTIQTTDLYSFMNIGHCSETLLRLESLFEHCGSAAGNGSSTVVP